MKKDELVAYQASKRVGTLYCHREGNKLRIREEKINDHVKEIIEIYELWRFRNYGDSGIMEIHSCPYEGKIPL